MTKKDVTPKREQMYVISDVNGWQAFDTLDELNYWLDVECMDITDIEGFLVEIVKPLDIKIRAQVEE